MNSIMENNQYNFGVLMMLKNKIETLLDKELFEYGVTAKQWYLSMLVNYMFDYEPTISQVAKVMGSSHQNVKQIANRLYDKQLIELYRDKLDKRAIRIKITDEGKEFWNRMKDRADNFVFKVFKGINEDTSEIIRNGLDTIYNNIYAMELDYNKDGNNND